jgi:glycosyl hydrolase family 10
VGSTPSRANLATALRRFTALGVEVAYTEVDIRHSSMPPSQSALVTQGNDFANVVGSCLDVDGCIGCMLFRSSYLPNLLGCVESRRGLSFELVVRGPEPQVAGYNNLQDRLPKTPHRAAKENY